MNIFYLDCDPEASAKQICMVHVRKMIVESTQMLSTAHHVLDFGNYTSSDLLNNPPSDPWCFDVLMKPTHANHPSSIWVREHKSHYEWLANYTFELMSIYEEHKGIPHKCWDTRKDIFVTLPRNIPTKGFFRPPPACMPDQFKHPYSVVRSYRAYLTAKYEEWQSREKPLKVEFLYGTPAWLTPTRLPCMIKSS